MKIVINVYVMVEYNDRNKLKIVFASLTLKCFYYAFMFFISVYIEENVLSPITDVVKRHPDCINKINKIFQ